MLEHFDSVKEKRELIKRMKRYFAKEKKVAEQTIERLDSLETKG